MRRRAHSFVGLCVALLVGPSLGCTAANGTLTSDERSGDQAGALGSPRTDYVVAEIDAANVGLDDAARGEKFAAMRESPSAFYRGTNHLYWKDLADSDALAIYGGVPETRTWLGGDMHVDNTGAFDDDQGDIVFGINDFDEAAVGDYQLDVWRMAVSLALLTRQNLAPGDEAAVLDAFSEAYLDTMSGDARDDGEMTRKFVASNTYGQLDDFLEGVGTSESRAKMLGDWTVTIGGKRALDTANNPDLAPVSASVAADVRAKMAAYRATLSGGTTPSAKFFTVKSVAARLHAGLGSLGTRRYYVLVEGSSSSQSDDRILDVKEQGAPTAFAYLPSDVVATTRDACGGDMAARTVIASKAMGYRVNDLLGWMTLADGRSYSVRERSPWKASLPTEELDSKSRLTKLAAQWGALLATHHARADEDADADVVPHSVDGAIDALTDGDHDGFRALIRSLAHAYADQVELDYQSFLDSY